MHRGDPDLSVTIPKFGWPNVSLIIGILNITCQIYKAKVKDGNTTPHLEKVPDEFTRNQSENKDDKYEGPSTSNHS